MIPENFNVALRAFVRRQPFRPFLVELKSGDRFRVQHPEAVTMRRAVALYVGTNGSVKVFDADSVSQLCDESGAAPT